MTQVKLEEVEVASGEEEEVSVMRCIRVLLFLALQAFVTTFLCDDGATNHNLLFIKHTATKMTNQITTRQTTNTLEYNSNYKTKL